MKVTQTGARASQSMLLEALGVSPQNWEKTTTRFDHKIEFLTESLLCNVLL